MLIYPWQRNHLLYLDGHWESLDLGLGSVANVACSRLPVKGELLDGISLRTHQNLNGLKEPQTAS